ncbi:Alpha/Beta hydrolase protein [Hyaloraphidium curvatum]|nr:Alpha/Beta hydrolase protein [Hyaloraphidium curvatum]
MAELDVTVAQGALKGTSMLDGRVRAFLGIPFGEAPRWQKPRPAPKWEATRDASRRGPVPLQMPSGLAPLQMKPQYYEHTHNAEQGEECLVLNVWAPGNTTATNLPVMCWIYGGAFGEGSAATPLYDGSNLVAKAAELGTPVIVVAIQYRLNVFGFLASKELKEWSKDGSGGTNLSLYDQRLGLMWIRDNISAFGGDPSNVTIFGESAGAISCDYLSVLFGHESLFRRAILQSGALSSTAPRPIEAAQVYFDALYKAAGGPEDKAGVAKVEFLLGKTGEELKAAMANMAPRGSWAPVADGELLKNLPLLAKKGVDALLCGTNADECVNNPHWQLVALPLPPSHRGSLFAALICAPGQEALAKMFLQAMFKGKTDELLKRYEEKYGSFFSAVDEILNETLFQLPVRTSAKIAAAQGIPTFRYRFTRPVDSIPANLRVSHLAEVPFVMFREDVLTEEERAYAEKMVRHWVNFAASGRPGEDFPEYGKTGETLVYGANGPKAETSEFRNEDLDLLQQTLLEAHAT